MLARWLLIAGFLTLFACGGGGGNSGGNTGTGDSGTGNSGNNTGNGSGSVVVTPEGGGATNQITVTVSETLQAKNTTRWNNYMELQLNTALAPLNSIPGLFNAPLPILYDECGVTNAFYSPLTKSITLCDELVSELYDFFAGRQGPDRPAQVANASVFIVFHEIGHALVDILNLSVLGNDESAADALAAVISAETGRSFAAIIGGLYLSSDSASFGDEHNSGEDRFGDIVCWAIGSDSSLLFNSSLQSLTEPFIESNRDCVAEYAARKAAAVSAVPPLANLRPTSQTRPELIAAEDPNPPKTESSFVDLLTTGNDFWRCEASGRESQVGYRFFGTTGQYQELTDGSSLFTFDYIESGTILQLEYTNTTSPFSEVISNIVFIDSSRFTAESTTEGSLDCRYFVTTS